MKLFTSYEQQQAIFRVIAYANEIVENYNVMLHMNFTEETNFQYFDYFDCESYDNDDLYFTFSTESKTCSIDAVRELVTLIAEHLYLLACQEIIKDDCVIDFYKYAIVHHELLQNV